MKQNRISYGISFFLFFGLLWWSLTENSSTQIWMGLLLVTIASLTALRSLTSENFPLILNMKNFLHFFWLFIHQSFKGGFQVALLAFAPSASIHSCYYDYSVRIPENAELARMYFASCLCIFPGTLSCGYTGNILVIHILDEPLFNIEEIQLLEDLTIRTFMRPSTDGLA